MSRVSRTTRERVLRPGKSDCPDLPDVDSVHAHGRTLPNPGRIGDIQIEFRLLRENRAAGEQIEDVAENHAAPPGSTAATLSCAHFTRCWDRIHSRLYRA